MGVTVAKPQSDEINSMSTETHMDANVVVSLEDEQTNVAVKALKAAVKNHNSRGLNMTAHDAEQFHDAVKAANEAFGSSP